MAAVGDCFTIGSTVSCTTCFNQNIEGEVLAFDHQTKMLILSILFIKKFISPLQRYEWPKKKISHHPSSFPFGVQSTLFVGFFISVGVCKQKIRLN